MTQHESELTRSLVTPSAPAVRLGTAAVPTPSGKLRRFALPNVEGIVAAIVAAIRELRERA